jgi:hypothetical protein
MPVKYLITPGQRFGRLVVIEQTAIQKRGSFMWRCRCDCGTERLVNRSSLGNGNTTSCGCIRREKNVDRCTRHGHSKRGALTATWNSWRGMIERCASHDHIAYARYGGRGISVCDRWKDFANFIADMGPRPKGLSLDRFPNNDGNYEPGNCRWATQSEQRKNQRPRSRKRENSFDPRNKDQPR